MRIFARSTSVALGAALLAGCACFPGSDTIPDPLPVLAEQQRIPQLALLDHILIEYFSGDAAGGHTTCVSVHDGRSAVALSNVEEAALMERHTTLAPLTRCSLQEGRWVDADDDAEDGDAAEATLINLHSFTCASDSSCSGWASGQTGATGMMSNRYTMEWDGGEWGFTRDPRLLLDR